MKPLPLRVVYGEDHPAEYIYMEVKRFYLVLFAFFALFAFGFGILYTEMRNISRQVKRLEDSNRAANNVKSEISEILRQRKD